jgi:hypothetical protein
MIGAILCNNPPVVIELTRGYSTLVDRMAAPKASEGRPD